MEVMEDGNLMDKVHILIQRDMEYYTKEQAVLQQTICPGIVGGRLDFPRSASFAAIKLVLWWEEEYVAAFRIKSGFLQKMDSNGGNDEAAGGCGGIVKASDPAKFVNLISKSAERLLEHLHVLTQEALDHADLSVLTGTIGAAALLKNCLWFYMQSIGEVNEQLQPSYKAYQEMTEALAERLLDLHCRLLSLYIMQEPDSLDWDNDKSFCESERGSYVIQMWWLYMQGTKDDLWETVPPKMAQRVFAGMLNESLTILTVRYTQACPSEARSPLLIVDISNLLLCVAQLLPSICDKADHFVGMVPTTHKILKDIHTKCQELLYCLILRGASLDVLNKVFRKGIESASMFKAKQAGPLPWITFALPNIFQGNKIGPSTSVSLELMVLLSQPQPNWSLLVKVLAMNQCQILKLILDLALHHYNEDVQRPKIKEETCHNFLCQADGSCKDVDITTTTLTHLHYYDLVVSTTCVILVVGSTDEFSDILLASISRKPEWAKCFDRRHVWNQIRPPWFEALLDLVRPVLPTITKTVIGAVQTGASMYQAMLIVLACFSQLWDCIDSALPHVAYLIQEVLPADITPLNHSALIQILIGALYTELVQASDTKTVKFSSNLTQSKTADNKKEPTHKNSITSFDGTLKSSGDVALAVAESLCSIDEDNKHTDQIEEFLEQIKDSLGDAPRGSSSRVEGTEQATEVLASDLLMTAHGKRSLKILYHLIKNNSEWFFQKLGVSEDDEACVPNKVVASPRTLLHTMFHIGYRTFDQLLSLKWQPNWYQLLQTPMGLSPERVWSQISQRWDFRNFTTLTPRDVQIVNNLTSILKQL